MERCGVWVEYLGEGRDGVQAMMRVRGDGEKGGATFARRGAIPTDLEGHLFLELNRCRDK